jgi:hypothetical protein
LVEQNWESAHEALLIAKQLRMQNMFENGDVLTNTWQKKI